MRNVGINVNYWYVLVVFHDMLLWHCTTVCCPIGIAFATYVSVCGVTSIYRVYCPIARHMHQ